MTEPPHTPKPTFSFYAQVYIPLGIAALVFAFWVGGLQERVGATEEALEKMHVTTEQISDTLHVTFKEMRESQEATRLLQAEMRGDLKTFHAKMEGDFRAMTINIKALTDEVKQIHRDIRTLMHPENPSSEHRQ